MARLTRPDYQYLLNDGTPNSGGFLSFFNAGTNTRLITYADSLQTIKNTNPVVLDAAGRPLTSIFFDGSARVVQTDANDVQISDDSPVGGEQVTGEFALWNALITYIVGSTVKGSNGAFYISLTDPNVNNNPVSPSPASWTEIRFLGVYNSSESYSIGDVIQNSVGALWSSVINSNVGNNPTTDSGTNWIPAVLGAKIAEVIALEARTTTVLPKVGAVALIALRINELQDAGPFTLPAASSVDANQIITLDFPDEFAAFEPVVNRAGSDTITDSTGTDTSITFKGSTRIVLISDGISDWRL
jgi:hypothetical protein